MKFRSSFLIFLLAAALPAQVDQLATTSDGGMLLFRSNFRLQSETDIGPQAKIYRWQGGNWTRVAAALDVDYLHPPDVSAPFVSTDGKVSGWQTYVGCNLCQFNPAPPFSSQISGRSLPDGFPRSNLQMSANSRYFVADSQPFPGPLRYLDSATGEVTSVVNDAFRHAALGIANDGTVLLQRYPGGTPPENLALWKAGEIRHIYSATRMIAATISAERGRVAFETIAEDGARSLVVFDTQSGERIPVATLPSQRFEGIVQSFARPAWDTSGRLLVYRSFDEAGQSSISVWDATTRESQTLLQHDEGFSSAVISGDGRIVWAVTSANRLVRKDRVDGSYWEVLPPLGAMTGPPDAATVPGSAVQIPGLGFQPGQTAKAGDQAVPILAADSAGLWVQVPWELDSGAFSRHRFQVRAPGNPFESLVTVAVGSGIQPRIATTNEQINGSALAKAVHQDYSGLVTIASPARPGETIHVYLTGMGPLDRPVATGEPGPYEPLVHPREKLACRLNGTPVEMPFLGYAAGLIGVYQADLTMPGELLDMGSSLGCAAIRGDGAVVGTTALIMTASTR